MILVAGGGLVVLMACLLPFSLRMLKRANKTALLRTPEHLNLLLEDDAPMPEVASRSFFSPDAKLDKKKR